MSSSKMIFARIKNIMAEVTRNTTTRPTYCIKVTYRFEGGYSRSIGFLFVRPQEEVKEDQLLKQIWDELSRNEQNKLIDVTCRPHESNKEELEFFQRTIIYGSGFIRKRVDGTDE